jgi:hypothetical protein
LELIAGGCQNPEDGWPPCAQADRDGDRDWGLRSTGTGTGTAIWTRRQPSREEGLPFTFWLFQINAWLEKGLRCRLRRRRRQKSRWRSAYDSAPRCPRPGGPDLPLSHRRSAVRLEEAWPAVPLRKTSEARSSSRILTAESEWWSAIKTNSLGAEAARVSPSGIWHLCAAHHHTRRSSEPLIESAILILRVSIIP